MHYIVAMGNVGNGKTHLVAKVCPHEDGSSNQSQSATKESHIYTSNNRLFQICDTPGNNAGKDERFEHNVSIAAALSAREVSR